MDRYRLNQILRILFFPVCDPEMSGKGSDPLLRKYMAYEEFKNARGGGASEHLTRNKAERQFKKEKERLTEYLFQINGGKARSLDDLKMLCEQCYPMKELYHQSREMAGKRKEAGRPQRPAEEYLSWYYIRKIAQAAQALLTYCDGVASIRSGPSNDKKDVFGFSNVFDKMEAWNLLSRMTAPDIYIAIYAVESGNPVEALSGQKERIYLSDKLLRERLKKGTAENHLHFHVGYNYELYWLSCMNLKRWRERLHVGQRRKGEEERLFQAAVFRYFAVRFLRETRYGKSGTEFFAWWKDRQGGRLCDYVNAMYRNECIGLPDDRVQQEWEELHAITDGGEDLTEYDDMLECFYAEYIELGTSSEFLLLYECCRYLKEYEDVSFASVFVRYLRIKNKALAVLQESYELKGLSYFQRKYRSARSALLSMSGEDEAVLEVFRCQERIPSLKKMEIRLAPDVNHKAIVNFSYNRCRRIVLHSLCRQLCRVFYAYRRSVLESILGFSAARRYLREEEQAKKSFRWKRLSGCRAYIRRKACSVPSAPPTLGIVFHFLKASYLSNTAGNTCWRSIRYGGEQLAEYCMVSRRYIQNIALALQEIRSSIPYISEYIVGIDAASDENAMEPWIFAPAYRALDMDKNIRVTDGARMVQTVQSMRFTYHVGEDFRHILSGLRHIDEVLEEFRYRPGDRLGHALAMGISPESWTADNEVVAMPIREWMEDLLWLWGKSVCDRVALPIQLEVLEDRIMDLAEKIYPHHEEINVRILYQAYRKKFKLPSLTSDMEEDGEQADGSQKGFCRYGDIEIDAESHMSDHLCMTNYCPVYEERGNQVMHVPVAKEDAQLYRLLQEYLIEKVERMGIYIETNPTSNLTIGDFSRMQEHPIFRWNAVREGTGHHAFAMVNSDDPVVFNTNVENELAYIYYAAEYQGYSKEEVLDWIDRIRQNGIEGSFVARQKSAAEILDETERILNCLHEKSWAGGW